jgi:hypothetical protein
VRANSDLALELAIVELNNSSPDALRLHGRGLRQSPSATQERSTGEEIYGQNINPIAPNVDSPVPWQPLCGRRSKTPHRLKVHDVGAGQEDQMKSTWNSSEGTVIFRSILIASALPWEIVPTRAVLQNMEMLFPSYF